MCNLSVLTCFNHLKLAIIIYLCKSYKLFVLLLVIVLSKIFISNLSYKLLNHSCFPDFTKDKQLIKLSNPKLCSCHVFMVRKKYKTPRPWKIRQYQDCLIAARFCNHWFVPLFKIHSCLGSKFSIKKARECKCNEPADRHFNMSRLLIK